MRGIATEIAAQYMEVYKEPLDVRFTDTAGTAVYRDGVLYMSPRFFDTFILCVEDLRFIVLRDRDFLGIMQRLFAAHVGADAAGLIATGIVTSCLASLSARELVTTSLPERFFAGQTLAVAGFWGSLLIIDPPATGRALQRCCKQAAVDPGDLITRTVYALRGAARAAVARARRESPDSALALVKTGSFPGVTTLIGIVTAWVKLFAGSASGADGAESGGSDARNNGQSQGSDVRSGVADVEAEGVSGQTAQAQPVSLEDIQRGPTQIGQPVEAQTLSCQDSEKVTKVDIPWTRPQPLPHLPSFLRHHSRSRRVRWEKLSAALGHICAITPRHRARHTLQPFPPHMVSQEDLQVLSTGQGLAMWEHESARTPPRPWVLYADVSGSMADYLEALRVLVATLESKLHAAYQFSSVIVPVTLRECGRSVQTTGRTDIRGVLRHARLRGYEYVLIWTDDLDAETRSGDDDLQAWAKDVELVALCVGLHRGPLHAFARVGAGTTFTLS